MQTHISPLWLPPHQVSGLKIAASSLSGCHTHPSLSHESIVMIRCTWQLCWGLGDAVSFSSINLHRLVPMPMGNQTEMMNDDSFSFLFFSFFLIQKKSTAEPPNHLRCSLKSGVQRGAPLFMGTETSRVEFISTAPSANTRGPNEMSSDSCIVTSPSFCTCCNTALPRSLYVPT